MANWQLMLAKVGPVIAQRDSVVKRLFDLKDDGLMAFTIDEGTDERKAGCTFFAHGKSAELSQAPGDGISDQHSNKPCSSYKKNCQLK